jgi:hypothetical protein
MSITLFVKSCKDKICLQIITNLKQKTGECLQIHVNKIFFQECGFRRNLDLYDGYCFNPNHTALLA